MDITPILLNAQSPDQNVRDAAEKQLQMFESQNLGAFLCALAAELGSNEKHIQARILAGIILKNALTAKDEQRKIHLMKQWLTLDPNIRQTVKATISPVMASPTKEARSVAAQVIAKIALVELPNNLWTELIQQLLNNMTISNEFLKQSTLETLGYICEEIAPAVIASQANHILTAVIQGMQKDEASNDVKLAGCRALFNALEFVKGNFAREHERNYIMQVVLEGTQSTDERLRVASYECLVKIASLYYEVLPAYVQHIFNVTLIAIKSDTEVVAQQAIEFWSTICDEESFLLEEAAENEGQPAPTCHNFIKGAIKFLAPVLTETLTKQDEDPDDDTWNSAMAAGTCLALIAATVGDAVVEFVMPFVTQHINNPDWRYREAATLAFGSILEGPKTFLVPLIKQAVPVLVTHMKDTNECVKDTTAWTLGRICQLHKNTVAENLAAVVQVLTEGLGDVPRVASNACWALHNLANPEEEDEKSALTPWFNIVVTALLQTTERDDSDENNLRCAAYEALNVIIQNAGEECAGAVHALVPVFVDRLEKSFHMPVVNATDKEAQNEAQALLCSVLTIIVQRLGEDIKPYADKLMSLFLQVFGTKNASVHEEALMAVGAVANAVEADFDKYMQHTTLRQFLYLGLRNWEEHQVCSVAVGVVGDICRAITFKIQPFCDEIISLLLADLKNPHLNKNVKPPILSCFGDMALAISGHFEKYLQVVMAVLQQAAATTVPQNDYDLVDYLNQLREGIFEAFTGIIQGLRGDNKSHLILPYVPVIISFINLVANDSSRTDVVSRGAVGVLGDLAHSLGNKIKPHITQEFAGRLITECMRSDNSATQDVAQWAQEVISKL